MKRRRDVEIFSMSFLDAICCGFGAMILLFLITRITEPDRLEESSVDLQGVIVRYEQEVEAALNEAQIVSRDLTTIESDLQVEERRIDGLQAELERVQTEVLATTQDSTPTNELRNRLVSAKQSLTDEMRRLLADYKPAIDQYAVGGIPVDSEYIVFLIDTSGSMKEFMWDRLGQQIRETLEVYPQVKGIQVMNDEGEYLFKSYRGEWIPDTPARRQAIIDGVRTWEALSNSNPREGIIEAIKTFYDADKKISLYVYSDDFASGSINAVVREVDQLNRVDEHGNRRVRIHAVALPSLYAATGELLTAAHYATLMRVVCQRNGGTFIALPLLDHRG